MVPLMNPFVKREKSLSESIGTELRKSAIFVRVTLITKLFLLELRCKPEKNRQMVDQDDTHITVFIYTCELYEVAVT
jgi:hypothetical protein